MLKIKQQQQKRKIQSKEAKQPLKPDSDKPHIFELVNRELKITD